VAPPRAAMRCNNEPIGQRLQARLRPARMRPDKIFHVITFVITLDFYFLRTLIASQCAVFL
jgi:hypothetical protein